MIKKLIFAFVFIASLCIGTVKAGHEDAYAAFSMCDTKEDVMKLIEVLAEKDSKVQDYINFVRREDNTCADFRVTGVMGAFRITVLEQLGVFGEKKIKQGNGSYIRIQFHIMKVESEGEVYHTWSQHRVPLTDA